MSDRAELDLSMPIIGNLADTIQMMIPDERATFFFFAFAGKPAVKTTIMLEQVDFLEPDTHLERFVGTDVSLGDEIAKIVPGLQRYGRQD